VDRTDHVRATALSYLASDITHKWSHHVICENYILPISRSCSRTRRNCLGFLVPPRLCKCVLSSPFPHILEIALDPPVRRTPLMLRARRVLLVPRVRPAPLTSQLVRRSETDATGATGERGARSCEVLGKCASAENRVKQTNS
jgi:hypothetical protein